MAGTVESSADPRFRRGDKVIVHAYDFGVAHDGGYAEYVRVPGDWIVRRSGGDDRVRRDDARHRRVHRGAGDHADGAQRARSPRNGPVAVTGATGGVGSVAIEILAKIGYHVVAITGKETETAYLRGLGAKEVRLRQSIDLAAASGRWTRRPGPARSTTSAATCWRGCCRA